jgi:hypothetical protein
MDCLVIRQPSLLTGVQAGFRKTVPGPHLHHFGHDCDGGQRHQLDPFHHRRCHQFHPLWIHLLLTDRVWGGWRQIPAFRPSPRCVDNGFGLINVAVAREHNSAFVMSSVLSMTVFSLAAFCVLGCFDF